MKNTSLKNELHQDLKKFGLNPAEWSLQKLRNHSYKIAHIKDSGFYFMGKSHLKGLRWVNLRLISL